MEVYPRYVVEEPLLRRNLSLIRKVADEAKVEIIVAFKAFALWKLFPIFREYGFGSTASSPWEMRAWSVRHMLSHRLIGCRIGQSGHVVAAI